MLFFSIIFRGHFQRNRNILDDTNSELYCFFNWFPPNHRLAFHFSAAIVPTGRADTKTKASIWLKKTCRITRHVAFDIFFGLVVISNAIFIGRWGKVLLRLRRRFFFPSKFFKMKHRSKVFLEDGGVEDDPKKWSPCFCF